MRLTSLVVTSAAILLLCSGRLIVRPDRSRFFRHETVSFSCSGPPGRGTRADRTTGVRRNASSRHSDPCESGWGTVNGSACVIEGLYTLDSGVYWCETEPNQTSDSIDINVSSDRVLLSVPVHPVLQGALVSLVCLSGESPSAEFAASFFRDETFIGNMSPATLTLSPVTPEDRGLYHCVHATRGSSRKVLLRVSSDHVHTTSWITETPPPSPLQPITVSLLPRLLCFGLLFLLYTGILIISLWICCKLAKDRAEAKRRRAGL